MRTSKKELDALVAMINEACGIEEPPKFIKAERRMTEGYSINAQSPGDGVTRYQLHYYSGLGTGVCDDCSWSWSLGAAEFAGKLRAFLNGLEHWGRYGGGR